MAVIVANPVAVIRAEFQGIAPCKNPDYFNVLLKPEYDHAGEFRPEKHLHSSEDLEKFNALQPGKSYLFKAALTISRANEKEGKNYPARLNFKVLEVKQ